MIGFIDPLSATFALGWNPRDTGTMTQTRLKARLQADLHDAMRARDKVRAGTLRMALTSVTTAEVAGDGARALDDEVLKVLAKEAKKRKEAAAAYLEAKRPELAATEEAELTILGATSPRNSPRPVRRHRGARWRRRARAVCRRWARS